MPMTSIERFRAAVSRKPVDLNPVAVSPWGATINKWIAEGHIQPGEDIQEHFGQDMRSAGWLNSTVDLDYVPETLEETEETILQVDGNGAKLRRHKLHDSTPEHVDFNVKDRTMWDSWAKEKLIDIDRRRVDFEGYRNAKKFAADHERFFCWGGVAPFEQMHPLCGHEYMLMGMALDPDWVKDMVMTYSELTVKHLELLFAEEGAPDGMFFYEDMGFKNRPFMSPQMYMDIIYPGHKLLFDYSHDHNCKVIVHSCGMVEPLVPGLIQAGMDCLQALEVKAGMHLPDLFAKYGDKISFFGGFDVRLLIANDRPGIDAEFANRVMPVIAGGGGYIVHSDHSEPPEVEYETMKYFVETGRKLGRV